MHKIHVTEDILWVGANDRRLARFENMFPLPSGVSYNSYLILDEKTALLDTVDLAVTQDGLQMVLDGLDGRPLDYLVIHHIEPDHSANIKTLALLYPNLKVVGNAKIFQFLEQFFDDSLKNNYHIVKDCETLSLGKHSLEFYMTPMVHWPEVMVSFETSTQTLFSADAFGSFGALSGNLFDDETDFNEVFLEESRRYYTNIVGKFGASVQAALKKLSALPIRLIAPLHGPVLRSNIVQMMNKYHLWSTYTPERKGVLIVYASMYGNTAKAANTLAGVLAEKGVEDIRMYDVSETNTSYLIAEVFKNSNIVLAAPTYNMGIYPRMEDFIREMTALSLQNRNYSIIGNGTWASKASKKMIELVGEMKNMTLIGEPLEITSALRANDTPALFALADAIVDSMKD